MRPAPLFALTLSLFSGLALLGYLDELGSTDQDSSFGQGEIAGSVSIPLVAAGADGSSYRLRSATFDISGSAMVTMAERKGEHLAALMTELPPGDYSVYLRPGFRVVEIKADGSEVPVPLNLISSNPVRVELSPMGEAHLELEFKSGDKRVSFGNGAPAHVTEVASDSL